MKALLVAVAVLAMTLASQAAVFPLDLATTVSVESALGTLLSMAQARIDVMNTDTSEPPSRLIEWSSSVIMSNYTTTVTSTVQAGVTSWWTNVYYIPDAAWNTHTNEVFDIVTSPTSRFVWAAGSGDSLPVAALDALDDTISRLAKWQTSHEYNTTNVWCDPHLIDEAAADAWFQARWATNWSWYASGGSTQWNVIGYSYPGIARCLTLSNYTYDPVKHDAFFYETVEPTTMAEACTNYWTTLVFTSSYVALSSLPGWVLGQLSDHTVSNLTAEQMYRYRVSKVSVPMLMDASRQMTNAPWTNAAAMDPMTLGVFRVCLWPHSNTVAAQYPLSINVSVDGAADAQTFEFDGYDVTYEDWLLWTEKLSRVSYASGDAAFDMLLTAGHPFQDSLSWTSSPAMTNLISVSINQDASNWLSELTWLYSPGGGLTRQEGFRPQSAYGVGSTQVFPHAFIHPDDLGWISVVARPASTNWTNVPPLSFESGSNEALIGWVMDRPGVDDWTNITPFRVRQLDAFHFSLSELSVLSNGLCGLIYNMGFWPDPYPVHPGAFWMDYTRPGRWDVSPVGIATGLTPEHLGDEIRLVHADRASLWGYDQTWMLPEALNARWEALQALRVLSTPPHQIFGQESKTTNVTVHCSPTQISDPLSYIESLPGYTFGVTTSYTPYSVAASWKQSLSLQFHSVWPCDMGGDRIRDLGSNVVAESTRFGSKLQGRWAWHWHGSTNVLERWSGSVYRASWPGDAGTNETACDAFPWPTNVFYAKTSLDMTATGYWFVAGWDDAYADTYTIGSSTLGCMAGSNWGAWSADPIGAGPGTYSLPCGDETLATNECLWREGAGYGTEVHTLGPKYLGIFSLEFSVDGN